MCPRLPSGKKKITQNLPCPPAFFSLSSLLFFSFHHQAHTQLNDLTPLTDDKMEFGTIVKFVPFPKVPSLGDFVIFPPIWAFLYLVCLCTKLATAAWPLVLSYLSFVVAFAPDKNWAVAIVSWLSLLRYWKPWAAATADVRIDVDLAVDFIFLVWFLMAFPVIVSTIWIGLKAVLRLIANAIIRRIHAAMEFEFDLTDYVVKCYSPMEPGSTGDRVVAQMMFDASSGDRNFLLEYFQSLPLVGLNKAGYEVIFRGRRPRRFVPRTFTDEERRAQERFKKSAKERCRQILAAKDVARTVAQQPIYNPKPTPSDSEQHASVEAAAASVPQPREAATPVAQPSAWPTDAASENVADDVTIASDPIETEELADQKESKGEGLVGPGPEAPEPEVSFEAEGNGLLEGVEDSPAQEPEFSSEKEGESCAEEPKSSYEEEGEGPLYEVGPANDPEASLEVEGEASSHASVPEAAQELETSFEEEGDGLLTIDAAPTEEPEASFEAEGEGLIPLVSAAESSVSDGLLRGARGNNADEPSFEGDFDVEMADAEPLKGMAVPRPFFTLGPDGSNSQDTILPLEVVAPRSPAGQEPGCRNETRGWLAVPDVALSSKGHQCVMDLSPVVESAQAVVEAQ